jgi:hypothetical protein
VNPSPAHNYRDIRECNGIEERWAFLAHFLWQREFVTKKELTPKYMNAFILSLGRKTQMINTFTDGLMALQQLEDTNEEEECHVHRDPSDIMKMVEKRNRQSVILIF